jgi:ATP-dependent DNA ligase
VRRHLLRVFEQAAVEQIDRDLRITPPPQWIEPELCKLVTRIPAGDNWAHEIKFDGFRMHARIVRGAAALLTRNGLDWTAKCPDVAIAIGALNCRQAYVDGELCAVLPDGTTSFSALQGHGDAPAELVYFAFDLLHLDGEDLMRLPLLERKARLETLLADAPPVLRYSGHIVGNGARVFEEGSKLGVEGMVSKQINKPYLSGNRGRLGRDQVSEPPRQRSGRCGSRQRAEIHGIIVRRQAGKTIKKPPKMGG